MKERGNESGVKDPNKAWDMVAVKWLAIVWWLLLIAAVVAAWWTSIG